MDCQNTQEMLLFDGPPSPGRLPPGELLEHLAACEDCERFASELARLDESWRAIPLPVGLEEARDEFLGRFLKAAAPKRVALRRRIPARWVIAASVLIALGVGGSFFIRPRSALASSDVVDRLVDWNLSLAHATSVSERGRIYSDRATNFADEVERSALPAEDRELARSLLDGAPVLVRDPDPLLEADRFNDLADKLVARMNRAARAGDAKRVDQSATLYQRVAELGIESKLDVLIGSVSLDFERQRRLERLVLRDADRMKTLVELLERVPDSSRKQIKRALGIKPRPKNSPTGRAEGEEPRKGRGRKGSESTSPSIGKKQ